MSLVGSSAEAAAGIPKMEAVKFGLAKALTLNLLPFRVKFYIEAMNFGLL
jgi:hypothetical protein